MYCLRTYICKLSSSGASSRLLSVSKLSSSHFHHHAISINSAAPITTSSCSLLSSPLIPTSLLSSHHRSLSTTNNNNNDDNRPNNDEDKNFLLQNDEDSLPTPPSYVRDSITGKWTDKTHVELSLEERKLLQLDEETKTKELMSRLEKQWGDAAAASMSSADDSSGDGFGTLHSEQRRVAHRIQEEKLALGTIGRGPSTSDDKENAEEEHQPLSSREFQALKNYASKEHNIHPKDFARLHANDPDLLPHNNMSSGRGSEGNSDSKQFYDADLDLAHLNPKLNKMAYSGDDNIDHYDPFADLLPSDFNPTRKVNRKHAKLLPKRLLHHNNLSLLRRYTTPGGEDYESCPIPSWCQGST